MNLSRNPSGSGFFLISLFFVFTVSSQQSFAQNKSVHGKVIDQQGNPVAGSSVYLSHTSKGVTTSASGAFHLENLPEGKFDLVASAIGYETKIIALSSDNYPANLVIALQLRATDLAVVVVEPTDRNGWRKYGRYFIDNFIGTTRNARFCKIINREVLRFRFSEKNNRLTVKADEPVIIENKMLGYRVSFQLAGFTADFNDNTVAFYGHPLFIDLNESDEQKRRKILSNRREVYYGSLMHFMRCVYQDNFKEQNFVVRASVTKPNFEKMRVKNILEDTAGSRHHGARYEITQFSGGVVHVSTNDDTTGLKEDSLRYYNKILTQRDTVTRFMSLESLSDLTLRESDRSKFLFFKNTMEVRYLGSEGKTGASEIMLQTPTALEVMKNGSYFSPTELVTFKYWGETEKMCNMLPLDYYPN